MTKKRNHWIIMCSFCARDNFVSGEGTTRTVVFTKRRSLSVTADTFSRPRLGHKLIPSHAYFFDLNSSTFRPRHIDEVVCNSQRIMFDCEALVQNRLTVFTYLTDRGLTVFSSKVLNSKDPLLIFLVVSFLHESGFMI